MHVSSLRPVDWGRDDEEPAGARERCAECGALIGDDQALYVYRISSVDGIEMSEPLCLACSEPESDD
jgi:hypothetical protein